MIAIRYKLSAVLALAILAGSCDDPAAPLPSGVVSVSVDSSAGSIIRVATITLERAAPVRVTYGGQDTPVLAIQADSGKTVYRMVLPRLRAATEYRLEAFIPGEGGVHATTFGTAPLPEDLARIQLTVSGQPSLPVSLMEIAGAPPTEFQGLLIIERGHIVGYIRVPGSLFGTTRRANGEIVVVHGTLGLVRHRLDGTVVGQIPAASAAAQYGRIHHDVTATPSNTLLFIADEKAMVGSDLVTGESLWEWNPEAGTVVKRWSAFDHLDWTTERGRGSSRSNANNWLHGNGIQFGPRGNVLMSLRNIHQVISIAPDFASVEWKFGGDNGTIAIPDGDRFFGQHYVSEPQLDRLLVYDNGFERPGCNPLAEVRGPGCYTRAVEYRINRGALTATKEWEYRHNPDTYATLVGSARRLPNGNTTVLFGMNLTADVSGPVDRTAVEVNVLGVEQWRLSVTSAQPNRLYRLTPVASLLGETPGSFH